MTSKGYIRMGESVEPVGVEPAGVSVIGMGDGTK